MKLPRSTHPYLKTRSGWAYLAAVLDLYSRKIVGWDLASNMEATLVISALERAQANRQAEAGLLVHSDRGCQYASQAFRSCIGRHQFEPSMSAKGNCYDNATMESFFGTLKREDTDREDFADLEEARLSVFSYIEAYYNRKRIHTSLGGANPESFECQWKLEHGFFEASDTPAGRGKKKAGESLPQPRPSVASSCYSLEGCFPAVPSSASQDDPGKAYLLDLNNRNLTEGKNTNPSGV